MSDDTTATAPQAGADGTNLTPQAGDTTTPEPQAGDGQETISLEEARKLRSEAANLRKRLRAFEEAETKAKEAQLTEQQRLQKQYEELKSQHDDYVEAQFEQMIDREIALQAAKLGVDPAHLERVSRFLEWEEIEIDEETGQPTNIRDLVEQLVKDMPGLKTKGAPSPTSGGATNPPRSQSSAPQALSWDVIGKMTPTEYNARHREIQEWILNNPPRFR